MQKVFLPNIQRPEAEKLQFGSLNLTTNKQTYLDPHQREVQENYKIMNALPHQDKFAGPLKSSYKDAFERQQIDKRPSMKKKDHNLFFALPSQQSTYQN